MGGVGIMGWVRRLLGKGEDPTTQEDVERVATVRWYDGDPPVPAITAKPRPPADFTGRDDETLRIGGFAFWTDDSRFLHPDRCGITRWGHLGIYVPEVVGESFRSQDELRRAVPGEPARLVGEPDNPYDAEAIRVETADGTHVGYVAQKATKSLRRAFTQAEDQPIRCVFLETYAKADGGDVVGVKIVLWRADALTGLNAPVHATSVARPGGTA